MKKNVKTKKQESIKAMQGSEHLTLFQNTIQGSANRKMSPVDIQVYNRNVRTIRLAAIAVVLMNVYWLISDVVRGGEMNISSGPALAAIIAQIVFSFYMMFLPNLVKKSTGRLERWSFILYYASLIIGVSVLAVTKNIQMMDAGTNYSLAGIALSTYYLFILIMVPLPSMKDSLILGVLLIVMMFVPAFCPGHEIYSLSQQIILRMCMIVAYWYIRDVNLALANSIQKLSNSSLTDPLTMALNRRALDMYWKDVCDNKRADKAGILIFDIDDFKKYNDHYTHAGGDSALIEVCKATTKALREDSGLLFRYGGEEFVVILLDKTDDEIVRCALNISKEIKDANLKRNDESKFDHITVTIGCASEKVGVYDDKNYVLKADNQLYYGKEHGKNCVVFEGKIYQLT